jgi:hypothetical protein
MLLLLPLLLWRRLCTACHLRAFTNRLQLLWLLLLWLLLLWLLLCGACRVSAS